MFVFFFKQKTAYEMRISDWSSDVCSSDLAGHRADARRRRGHHDRAAAAPGDLRHDVLHAQPHAADVDGDDPVEVLLRLVLDPRDLALDAGVEQGDVDAAEPLDGGGDEAFDLCRVGDRKSVV